MNQLIEFFVTLGLTWSIIMVIIIFVMRLHYVKKRFDALSGGSE